MSLGCTQGIRKIGQVVYVDVWKETHMGDNAAVWSKKLHDNFQSLRATTSDLMWLTSKPTTQNLRKLQQKNCH